MGIEDILVKCPLFLLIYLIISNFLFFRLSKLIIIIINTQSMYVCMTLLHERVHLISNNERGHCMVLYTGIQQEIESSQNTLKKHVISGGSKGGRRGRSPP